MSRCVLRGMRAGLVTACHDFQGDFRVSGGGRTTRYVPPMSAQLELFGQGEPRFDATFAAAKRVQLLPDAWLEFVPGWLRGHQALCDTLVSTIAFRANDG
jgi:hypothetical protein